MQTECIAALRTQRMPTTRNEEYRFTDVGPLLQIQPKAGLLASDVSSISSCSSVYHVYMSNSNCLPCCPYISSAVHVNNRGSRYYRQTGKDCLWKLQHESDAP